MNKQIVDVALHILERISWTHIQWPIGWRELKRILWPYPFFREGGSSLKEKINNYELPTGWNEDTFNEPPWKACKTLIIYQISQNKSIGYEDKDDTKKT